jgi:hypothetical protein
MAEKLPYEKYIIPVAAVIGGYFLLKNFGLFGGGAASQNQAGITTAAAAGVTTALQQAKASGDIATLNPSQAAALANNIYNAGVADPVDQDTIQNSIIQANTLTDLLNIIQAFGTKQAGGAMCSIFGGFLSATCGTYDLAGWITANLDATHIATVNGYFQGQNINYKF